MMMRFPYKKCYFTIIAVLWMCGMFVLVKREYFLSHSEEVTSDYQEVLVNITEKRHTSMAIFYGFFSKQQIGTMYSMILPQTDAAKNKIFEIDTSVKLSFAIEDALLFQQLQQLMNIQGTKGKKFDAGFLSTVHVGADYELQDIKFQFQSELVNLAYEGQVKDGKLFLTIKQDGKTSLSEVPLPPGTMMANSIGFIGQFPKLKVGKRFHMRWFDPFTQEYKVVQSKVIAERRDYIWAEQEPAVHAYKIQTRFGLFQSEAWVTEEGDILEYKILAFLFVKQPTPKAPSKEDILPHKDKS